MALASCPCPCACSRTQRSRTTHEPESLTEASLGLWRVNVTSASRINATTPN
ncbi:MAG: hypothetical protein VB124_03270 [Burkholderia sp.]